MTSKLGSRHTSLACCRAEGDSAPPVPIQGLLNLEFAQATLEQVD
jgi:hypothetical protein